MDTCPNCGYCKHCGRSNGWHPAPIYPTGPIWVYPNWTGGFVPTTTTGVKTGSVTIRTDDAALSFTNWGN